MAVVKMTAHKLACFVILLTTVYTKTKIRHGPVNTMVFHGTNTTLNCTGIDHSTVVKWVYYADGSLPINITYMNPTLFTRYDLYLGIVGLEHAGVYGCYSSDGEHRAQLIILESEPVCFLRINDEEFDMQKNSVSLNDKDVVHIWCQVRYSGGWPPTMTWGGLTEKNLFQAIRNETSDDTKIAKTSLKFNPSMFTRPTVLQLSCRTYFVWNNKSWEGIKTAIKPAENIPDYNHTWYSPSISVTPPITDELRQDGVFVSIRTISSVAVGVGLFILGLIAAGILFAKCRAKNSQKATESYAGKYRTKMEPYCEINESEMDQLEQINRVGQTGAVNGIREDDGVHRKNEMDATQSSMEEEEEGASIQVEEEEGEYVNEYLEVITERATYENVDPTEDELKKEEEEEEVEKEENNNIGGIESGISPVVSRDNKVNKSYVPVDPSTRQVCPPSVYNRLKNTTLRNSPGSSTPVHPPKSASPDIDRLNSCNTGRRPKPKVPTPESSSPSESPK